MLEYKDGCRLLRSHAKYRNAFVLWYHRLHLISMDSKFPGRKSHPTICMIGMVYHRQSMDHWIEQIPITSNKAIRLKRLKHNLQKSLKISKTKSRIFVPITSKICNHFHHSHDYVIIDIFLLQMFGIHVNFIERMTAEKKNRNKKLLLKRLPTVCNVTECISIELTN